jgi:ribose 5-phosphate isomerase B
MKLAMGSDHAGFKLKSLLIAWLRSDKGGAHRILDVGTASDEPCDYPDYAVAVAKAVSQKRASKGILLCGTGIGMAMAANKVRGVRAAVVWNPTVAALAAEHNDANVLCLPARFGDLSLAKRMIKTFLATRFAEGRHARRVRKIMQIAGIALLSLRFHDRAFADVTAAQHFQTGLTYERLGRYDEAYTELQLAFALDQTNPQGALALGIVACRLGRIDAAERALEHAIALEPNSAASYFHLGLLYEKENNIGRALDAWHRFLSLSQDDLLKQVAQKHIQYLESHES